MSFDRQIDQACPHLVVEEALFLGANRTTVRPIRPISAFNSVVVRLNRLVDVPSQGVETFASVEGSRPGPFNVQASSNTMILQVGYDAVQNVTIPTSAKMSVNQLANLLNASFTKVSFSVTVNNRLSMRSSVSGKSARVVIKSGSTLATLVGMPVNKELRGQLVVPGWTLISDPTTLASSPSRLVIFDSPLKGYQDFVELNYTTIRQECRRCGGLGVENDWRYGADGSVAEVRDEALLIQELLKITYTQRGSNPFNLWYGSTLLDQIGAKLGATGLVQNTIVNDIYTVFRRWQSIKKQQEENTGQFVSDEEYPFRILAVDLQQSTEDPTVIFVTVQVQNRSGNPINIERGLKLPEPTNLLGSTAAQGVFRQSLKNYALVG